VGAVPGPQDCFLVLRGLKTLALRMEAHSRNADRIARFLAGHRRVRKVYYPGLPDHPGHRVAAAQMRAFGGMVSFETETEDEALEVCRRTKLFYLAESLGGVESLIEHPGRMTHASVAGSALEVPGTLVRLSVGIEHPDDLLEDLDQALS
jgi:cystathionine gamma-synthase